MFRHVAGFALRLAGAYQDAGAYGACPWAPMPKDEDFREAENGAVDPSRQFAQCAMALNAAGGHASALWETMVFGRSDPARCNDNGLTFQEMFLSPRYLAVVAAPETSRSGGWHEVILISVCIPSLCQGAAVAGLALPRLLEWRHGKAAMYHPSPGPCAVAPTDLTETLGIDDSACMQHLSKHIFLDSCIVAVYAWRIFCDASFFNALFGAQIRSLPEDDLGSGSQFAVHQEAALMHYSRCKEGAGSYMGMYFNGISESAAGYALGMCVPSLQTTWGASLEQIMKYRLGLMMSSSFPDVEIDADSVKATELMHRSELQVDWAIIGLGRSGTTSLAAWLDSHPRLRLIRDESDNFREGAFDYLFRRSLLEHLIPRVAPLGGPPRPGGRRSRTVAPRNWIDWLKSVALFVPTTACFPRNLATHGEDGNPCDFPFEKAHVFEHVSDLELKGVARYRIKVVHLNTLQAHLHAAHYGLSGRRQRHDA
ncbi:unnamed protein product [Cladocopium goreaui]|uniref:Protein-tyrosine sulfotransferase n=1 Tax=Cladocopium goreaui TaxID=2562237 RepID=A0A9P1CBL3_9DINO|nr:unnamed protein product [Cladocopium goreaui]